MNTPVPPPANSSSADPLANLKDIHLPPEISWWPIAPGWWMLLALLLVLVTTTFLLVRYRIRRNAYRKAALQELEFINRHYTDTAAYIEAVAALLRRTAISADNQRATASGVARLQGREWQQYLQTYMPAEAAEWIAINRYQASHTINREVLTAASREWIKRHKV